MDAEYVPKVRSVYTYVISQGNMEVLKKTRLLTIKILHPCM